MKLRIYGNIKDTKTARPIIGANVRLFLDKKMLQQVKSIENGFFEIVAEIDDSRIESGQQLRVTIEKEGYKMQEHRVLTTEGSFNLDVTLEPLVVRTPKKSFNWLPVIMGGGIVFVLIAGGAITWMFLSRAKSLRIINFSLDSSSIEVGEPAMLSWDTKNASSVKIEPDIGKVELSGNIKVQPTRTMEYILIAKNEEGKMISKALTLEVSTRAADKFLDTSDTTQIKSGGLNIMGSLGIGTTTPSTELEVNGTVTAKAFSGSLNWSNIANIPAVLADGDNVNDADADPGNEIQRLSTKGNEITLSKGGSVIAPYALNADKVDGKDASELGSGISGSGSTHYIAKWIGSGSLGNSVIYDNGNVGIGATDTAGHKLRVEGYTLLGGGIANSHFPYINGWAYVSGKGIIFREDAAGRYEERMRIADNGNVGIGTTAPGEKLQVMGNVKANNYLRNSDVRFKKNIALIENALDKVSALRGVAFEWRTEEYPEIGLDEGQEIGLIAQEVEEVLPNMVSEDNDGYKSLDYSKLSPVLIEAIKELKAEMDELREENATLKERIAVLEERY